MLKADKINLVGEFHSESDARRDAEKEFCLAAVKNSNYWVEHLFPDVYDGDKLANLPGAGTAT
ncbi:hypothetical protein BJF79_26760 [Actinomadura sp. CNU-125]|uniref:hypothetical protein n=1 Tax=Actinomadura sp. CNU-125 TaxID=1904961 RepID=UPI000963973D|nr:hypothetical protein [Actinomadura sp. CNU-125]OLT38443.1 hypothetical protein BJF79_26760 [Actinomadura sp. CNU-125]